MDEVCLYDKALSAAEITGIMSIGCVGSGNPPTLTSTATPAGSDITIYAAGRDGSEQMSLLVDDQVEATYNNIGGDYDTGQFIEYTYQHDSNVQAAQIKVRFDNDGPGKDIRVGHISIDGNIYQSEAATTFSTGTWSSPNGCDDDYKESEILHCNGYFWYHANAIPEPSPTPTATQPLTATASPTPPPTNEVTTIQRTYYSIAGQAVGVRVKKILTNGSTESDDLYYMYTDHLGNVGALSDKNGNYITDSLTLFRPFGDFRRTPSTNPDITDRAFTGHSHNNSGDNNLGLIYMRARWYLP